MNDAYTFSSDELFVYALFFTCFGVLLGYVAVLMHAAVRASVRDERRRHATPVSEMNAEIRRLRRREETSRATPMPARRA